MSFLQYADGKNDLENISNLLTGCNRPHIIIVPMNYLLLLTKSTQWEEPFLH